MKHLMKCNKCLSFTLKKTCSKCNKETIQPRPPKFSPEDKYEGYRRKAKIDKYKEQGLY